MVSPLLISFAAVTRIQYDVGSAVVEAGLVSAYLPSLAEHPVLNRAVKRKKKKLMNIQLRSTFQKASRTHRRIHTYTLREMEGFQ